jgi:hypothetical protein
VDEMSGVVEPRHLGVGRAALDVRHPAVGRGEHVVVAGGAVGTERRGHHLVQRPGPDHLQDLVITADPDLLVVRTELVAGQ